MRFVGIDVAAERHVVAVVDETGAILLRATPVTEDTPGYQQLLQLMGRAEDCLVAMEATGHYWRNLYAALVTAGFEVALLNPLRTRRFAEEELQRTKTEAIDAVAMRKLMAVVYSVARHRRPITLSCQALPCQCGLEWLPRPRRARLRPVCRQVLLPYRRASPAGSRGLDMPGAMATGASCPTTMRNKSGSNSTSAWRAAGSDWWNSDVIKRAWV